ncbi:MAG TPA: hypothetical protein PLG47_03665 [Candidatus Dojkabacteria bacterium]|nr:hypothetical protein [Candidatus Dojkabacteria bacterium]
MINLDTIKVYGSFTTLVKGFNKKHARVIKKTTITGGDNKTEEQCYEIQAKDIPGISRIEYKPHRDKITIEGSSKILQGDYYRHINKNTIEQAVFNLNYALQGAILFNPLELLEGSYIARFDILKDVKMKDTERRNLYQGLLRNPKEGFILQPKGKNDSLIITKQAKSNNCRMTLYNKLEEMTRGTNKTQNLQLFDPYKHFIDTTRTELILRKKIYIRKYLKLEGYKGDIPLKAGLLTEANPLLRFLREFNEANQNPPLFETLQERLQQCTTFEDYLREYGLHSLLRDTQYKVEILREIMRPFYGKKSSLSRALKGIKIRIAEEKALMGTEQTMLERYMLELESQ